MEQILVILTAFGLAAVFTPAVRNLALRFGVVDRPDGGRKAHAAPTALLGGLALVLAMALALFVAAQVGWLLGEGIKTKHLVGIVVACAVLAIGGALDDKYNLKPAHQIAWPVMAALAVIASGIGIDFVTNPFADGVIHLDRFVFTALWWDGIPYKITVIADILTVVWLLGMTYATKLLDGADGLVAGNAVIGAVVLAFVSVTREVAQPDTALFALVVAGVFLGFLIYNFPPASIFLGEGGSTMAGFLLGAIAIVTGGKVATALLVLGIPLLDAAYVAARRVIIEKRSPFSGDRLHLHHRLRDRGWSAYGILALYWSATAAFGISAFLFRGADKLIALAILAAAFVLTVKLVPARPAVERIEQNKI